MFKLINKKIFMGLIIGILFIIVGLCYFVGVKFFNTPLTNVPINDVVLSEDISENGITLQLLSSEVGDDNVITKTFTYTVEPENATNQSITAKATYTNETDCSEYLEVEVDESTKTVTIYCYKDFSNLILVRLVSVSNKSATATITINYEKKVKEIQTNRNGLYVGGYLINVPDNFERSYYIMQNVTPIYSNYTVDKQYQLTETHTTPVLHLVSDQYMNDDLEEKLVHMVDTWITNGYCSFSEYIVWNLSEEKEWHDYLTEISNTQEEECVYTEDNIYVYRFTSNITFRCGDIEITVPTTFYISLYHDYSELIQEIEVESIKSSITNIVF